MASTTPPDPDRSRQHRAQAGTDFIDAIWLDGYEHQSIWGYDTGVASFFAQVWANGSDSEQPELWLTPPDHQMSWPQIIVPPLVDFTGADPLAIVRAMGIAAPAPVPRRRRHAAHPSRRLRSAYSVSVHKRRDRSAQVDPRRRLAHPSIGQRRRGRSPRRCARRRRGLPCDRHGLPHTW